MTNSLGHGYICQSIVPFCYSDKTSGGDTSVELNIHVVFMQGFWPDLFLLSHLSSSVMNFFLKNVSLGMLFLKTLALVVLL